MTGMISTLTDAELDAVTGGTYYKRGGDGGNGGRGGRGGNGGIAVGVGNGNLSGNALGLIVGGNVRGGDANGLTDASGGAGGAGGDGGRGGDVY